MININYLRNKSFWFLDFLNGGAIKKHFKEIDFIQKNPNNYDSLKIRTKNLENILKHASNTTPFYSDFKSTKNLLDFPVIGKTVIQEDFEKFQSKAFINKENYKVSTSGSTGIPFFLFQNDNKRKRNTADVLHFSEKSNFILGECLYELEVWRGHNKKSALKSWLQNVIQFDISKLNDERIKEFLELMKSSKKKKNILGFASSYELICQYLDRNPTNLSNLNMQSIVANSEYLNEYTKTKMSDYFNTPALSRYSSEEIGIIAQQTANSPNEFKVNHASYYVELLDLNEDKPAKDGDFGRIVVTDLFNYSMPIIRYDTGDIARFTISENGAKNFDSIEGRKMDLIYDTKGNLISSFVIYTKFYEYYKLLKQYQFIQQGIKDYEIKLNIIDKFPFEKQLIDDVKNDFGSDANVTITYVDEIPTLSSGKRKKVVNNYHAS
jgi:phenylacetate-CoA ligase